VFYGNPRLNWSEASKSMMPLQELAEQLGPESAAFEHTEMTSYNAFFNQFVVPNAVPVGRNIALGSRLVPASMLRTNESRKAILDAMMFAFSQVPDIAGLVTAPFSYAGRENTSISEAWRSSIFEFAVLVPWGWNASSSDKQDAYSKANMAIQPLRELTPDAAYQNEASVYEPNHEVAFWGSNYNQLLKVKEQYDQTRVLDCWHCVGFDKEAERFSCYL